MDLSPREKDKLLTEPDQTIRINRLAWRGCPSIVAVIGLVHDSAWKDFIKLTMPLKTSINLL